MASGRVRVICGAGNGKSASALGYAMMGVFRGKRVIMVQFLKGMIGEEAADVLKRLEPDLKFFCFANSSVLSTPKSGLRTFRKSRSTRN